MKFIGCDKQKFVRLKSNENLIENIEKLHTGNNFFDLKLNLR